MVCTACKLSLYVNEIHLVFFCTIPSVGRESLRYTYWKRVKENLVS